MTPDPVLWPLFLYLGAALFLARLARWLGPPVQSLAALLTTVVAFLSVLSLLHNVAGSAMPWSVAASGTLSNVGLGVRFAVDGLGASFLLLSGLVGMAVLLAGLREEESSGLPLSGEYLAGLLSLLGGLAALALAGDLWTLMVAGLLLDAGLLLATGMTGKPRWLLVILMHSLVVQGLLLAATVTLWRDTGSTVLTSASEPALFLVTAAAMIRMAPLPFSLFPVAFEPLSRRLLALLPLATLGAGALMLGRVAQAAGEGPLPGGEAFAAFAALGVALAGWVAWRREEPSLRLLMLSAVQAGWVLWAFAWGLPAVALTTAWGGVLALAALTFQRGEEREYPLARFIGILASAVLIGVPGSALWGLTTAAGGQAWSRDLHGLMVLGAVGIMATIAVLANWITSDARDDGEPEALQHARLTGAFLLAALSIPLIGALWGVRVPEELAFSPEPAGPLAAQLAIPILGWAGGLWLWRVRIFLYPLYPLLDSVGALFSFVWLWRILGRVGWLFLRGLRGIMLVLEGENYGWLLLFLFVALIFLLQG